MSHDDHPRRRARSRGSTTTRPCRSPPWRTDKFAELLRTFGRCDWTQADRLSLAGTFGPSPPTSWGPPPARRRRASSSARCARGGPWWSRSARHWWDGMNELQVRERAGAEHRGAHRRVGRDIGHGLFGPEPDSPAPSPGCPCSTCRRRSDANRWRTSSTSASPGMSGCTASTWPGRPASRSTRLRPRRPHRRRYRRRMGGHPRRAVHPRRSSGPAGGRFAAGSGGEQRPLDAIEFCRSSPSARHGNGILRHPSPSRDRPPC